MDTSIFAFDLPLWLSRTSEILYVASFCFALFVIVLVSCMVGQAGPAVGHSNAHKRRTHLAH
jgi:hypothetical protein